MACGKKNARGRKAWIFFQGESGVSQRPSIRQTPAPKGETPVLIHALNRSNLSICQAINYRWDSRRGSLFFQTRAGAYNSKGLIAFLRDFKRHLHGSKAILMRDGLPWRKGRAMTHFLDSQRSWLSVERLPGYAPDLNPLATLWGNVRRMVLANRCAEKPGKVLDAVRGGMARVWISRTPAFAFLKNAELSF